MAKRRTKTRTHRKVSEEELAKIPRSIVLRLGSSLKNHSLSQLVKDFRNVMQPHTAINLRERKSNKLKDFIVMAGPLGVTDLFIFNQSEDTGNISLRIGKMPRGPTLQFKINTYSLIKDVRAILKHPKSLGKDSKEFLSPPLLVLNGFSNKINETSNHEKLMITVFQNMFPPIQPQSTKVGSIKRVLMINKDPETGNLDLRHYAIDTKLVEESRNVKKLIQNKRLPNMAKNTDISDLLLDPYSVGGITSDSEVEEDENIVDVHHEAEKKKEPSVKKRAIKLTELGPRINMSLVKIEEGLIGSSKTLYHATIQKSELEQKALAKKHEQRQKMREERRARQQANVKAKNAAKEEKKARRKARKNGEVAEGAEGTEGDDGAESASEASASGSESDSDGPEMDPADYENDSDLYSDIEK